MPTWVERGDFNVYLDEQGNELYKIPREGPNSGGPFTKQMLAANPPVPEASRVFGALTAPPVGAATSMDAAGAQMPIPDPTAERSVPAPTPGATPTPEQRSVVGNIQRERTGALAPPPPPKPQAQEPAEETADDAAFFTRSRASTSMPTPSGGGVLAAIGQEQAALQQGAKEQRSIATLESAYMDEFAKQREASILATREADERRKQAVDGQMTRLRASEEAYAKGEIDPGRIWRDKGTGEKALAIIGVALGAFGSSLTGGPNAALHLFENMIERDIQAQREDLAKQGQVVDFERNRLAELRQVHGDDRSAEAALRVEQYNAAEIQMKRFAAARGDAATQANAEIGIAQLQQKKELARAQFAQAAAERAALNDLTAGGGNLGMLPEGVRERYVPGLGQLAATPKDKEKIVEALDTREKMVPVIDRLLSMRRKHGKEAGITDESASLRAQANSDAAALLLQVKTMEELGVLSEQDVAIVEKMIGSNPLSVWSRDATVLTQLEAMRERVERNTGTFIRNRGLTMPKRPKAGAAKETVR